MNHQDHSPGISRGKARSAARLAAVQAVYQNEMEPGPIAPLLHEYHLHRLGAEIEDAQYLEAETQFFDDLVRGTLARRDECDALIGGALASGWTLERLDRTMRALLRVGTYELLARPDVPTKAAINEYIDLADAFFDRKDKGFVNGLLDAIARKLREAPARSAETTAG